MGAQHDRKMLGAIQHAVTKRWPTTPERRQAAVELVCGLLENAREEKTQLKAAQVLVSMELQNQRDEAGAVEAARATGPGVTVNITNAQVTVAPSAMTSFLADCIPPAPQVIEHKPDSPEQSPS